MMMITHATAQWNKIVTHPRWVRVVYEYDAARRVINTVSRSLEQHAESLVLRLRAETGGDPRYSTRGLHDLAERHGDASPLLPRLLRHTHGFLNSPEHDHTVSGYALPIDGLPILFAPAERVAGSSSVACAPIDTECVVVHLGGPLLQWDTRADRILLNVGSPVYASSRSDVAPFRADLQVKLAARREAAAGLLLDSTLPHVVAASANWLEISRVVDTALTILEARRWHLTATTTSGNLGRTPPPVGKVFVVPVTRGNVNRAVLLGVVLSLLAPTYHTGDHDVQSQKSAKGAAPTIGINDAIADMNGVMHRLVGDMKNGDSPPHRHSEIDADAVRLLQVHLRAITWRTHSSWDLLSKKRSGEKVDDACWCALSPEYVAKHEWHWPPVSHVVAPPKRKAEQQLARQQARQRASLAEEPIDLTGDDACMVLSEIAMPARVVRVKLEHEAAEIPRQIHQAVEVPLAIVVQAVVTLVSPVLSPFHMSNSSSSSSSSELPDWPMLDDNSGFSGYQSPMAQLTDLDAADSYFSSAYEQVVHHTTPLSPVPEYDSSSLPPVRTDAHVWPAVPQVPMEEIAPTRPSTPVVEPPVVVAPPAAPPAAPVDPTSIPHPLAAFMSVVTCARTVTQAQMDSFWSLDTFAREAAMHGVIIAVKDLAIARG